MPLRRVRIQSFRCIAEVELELHAERNYIFGPNGAGKTSLLEAIYLLGRGRSFRTRRSKRLIKRGQAGFAVFGELQEPDRLTYLGVSLGSGGLQLRLDGAKAAGMAALAERLPVHVIEPNIHQLIEGGPGERRRFLDWGVFHVEHGYLDAWRRFRRVLGQRNAALKAGSEVACWDAAFLEAAGRIHRARATYCERLAAGLVGLGEELLGCAVEVSYRKGWAAEVGLAEALAVSGSRDGRMGATQAGPHRADLTVSMDARGVREEVSRGQQKLVAAALILAQIRVFAAGRRHGGVLLVDDPAAELDSRGLAGLMTVLDNLPAQLVLTGLSAGLLPPPAGYPVFHVEQGQVTSVL